MQEQKLSRVDISRTIGETGLCFAIEKKFVEQLNGKVYAKIDKSNLKIILEF